jgi:hypothetical protein
MDFLSLRLCVHESFNSPTASQNHEHLILQLCNEPRALIAILAIHNRDWLTKISFKTLVSSSLSLHFFLLIFKIKSQYAKDIITGFNTIQLCIEYCE